jgi:hypothetical protein
MVKIFVDPVFGVGSVAYISDLWGSKYMIDSSVVFASLVVLLIMFRVYVEVGCLRGDSCSFKTGVLIRGSCSTNNLVFWVLLVVQDVVFALKSPPIM